MCTFARLILVPILICSASKARVIQFKLIKSQQMAIQITVKALGDQT